MNHQYIPHVQVRNDCIVLFDRPVFPPVHKNDPLGLKTYSGTTTSGNVKRMRSAIDVFLQKSVTKTIYNPVIDRWHPFRLAFVTLTIPDNRYVKASYAHKVLLKPFLRSMSTQGSISYIWKAELQQRGQLHYHVTWNQFRDHSFIRNKWNNRLRKAGLMNKFAKENGHFNANSTDVHSVRLIRNFQAYLTKYLSKDPGGKIDGKIWDCSVDLKVKRFTTVMTYHNEDAIKSAVEGGHGQVIRMDHCTIVKLKKPLDILTLSQQHDYMKWKQ